MWVDRMLLHGIGFYEMVTEGVGGGFGTVGDSELGEDGLHVRLCSVFRDAKLLCGVVIGQSTCERMKRADACGNFPTCVNKTALI